MEHTYLRYECADSFGLVVATSSSKAPHSNSTLGFGPVVGKSTPLMLITAGSQVLGVDLKSSILSMKLGHRELLSGGVGTGRALNSDEVVCLDVLTSEHETTKVATGWVDGAVRIFDVDAKEFQKPHGLVHSLLDESGIDTEFVQREPLVLNGHNQSPVRTLSFDRANVSRLASGGSDGALVLWDIVSETGLFRLIGHRGGITDISFVHLPHGFDGLVSSSLDGLVKVWDLKAQCCTQTVANHRGEVWSSACRMIATEEDEASRWRLVTGSSDGRVRVWSVEESQQREALSKTDNDALKVETGKETLSVVPMVGDKDDICFFVGTLTPPPNVATSSERIASVHFSSSGRFVGVLHANSKSVDIYLVRTIKESQKKRQRRLRRRQEKLKRRNETDKSQDSKKRGILDEDESSDDELDTTQTPDELMDPSLTKASDEFEYITSLRCGHKIAAFSFLSWKEKREMARVVCALSTNSLEVHAILRPQEGDRASSVVIDEKVSVMDMYGHPTGIRAVALSSDDRLACTVSKNVTKVWNVSSRTCIQSLAPSIPFAKKGKNGCYGLCTVFLPGNTHVAVGTREGHLLLIDVSAGAIVYCEEEAHEGAIWSIDIRRPTASDSTVALVTGSADKSVKFWDVETQEDENNYSQPGAPMLVHTRTLQLSDDVVAVKYSHSVDSKKRMVFVSTLDSTVKVFFDDSLKLFLTLYGHKLPALAVDASDDDMILASGGADKTIKIWGLDFGDTHKTLHGHQDSITDVKFVRRTHNFFTVSKDSTVRYWDGDRFEQILLLQGHSAEVNCLAISRTGAFLLTGGMDRQIRVWERTNDIVFLEEERERQLEDVFDKVERDEGGTAAILNKRLQGEEKEDEINDDAPQSEAAVKRSILSVSAGDRVMEAIEKADEEKKEIANFRRIHGLNKTRPANHMLFGLEPAQYVLWVLKSIKSSELEQSLLVLPLTHLERLMYYLIVLLRSGRGVELCARTAIFMVKIHQNQIIADGSLAIPLRELRRLVRLRLSESRDVVGFDMAALRIIGKVAHERKQSYLVHDEKEPKDVWAGLGLGSDVAAALEGRGRKSR